MRLYKTIYKKERFNVRCVKNDYIRVAGRGYSLHINRSSVKQKVLRAIKFLLYIIAAILLFKLGQAMAFRERGYHAVGGEMFILFLPVLVPLIKQTIKDLKDIF